LLRSIGLGQVVTRGTPPRKEGCRPASRGYALALVTCLKDRRPALECQSSERLSHLVDSAPATDVGAMIEARERVSEETATTSSQMDGGWPPVMGRYGKPAARSS